jgi:hypothetical protein
MTLKKATIISFILKVLEVNKDYEHPKIKQGHWCS